MDTMQIKRLLRAAPDPIGQCLWCGSSVAQGVRWCCYECRMMYEEDQQTQRERQKQNTTFMHVYTLTEYSLPMGIDCSEDKRG